MAAQGTAAAAAAAYAAAVQAAAAAELALQARTAQYDELLEEHTALQVTTQKPLGDPLREAG